MVNILSNYSKYIKILSGYGVKIVNVSCRLIKLPFLNTTYYLAMNPGSQ